MVSIFLRVMVGWHKLEAPKKGALPSCLNQCGKTHPDCRWHFLVAAQIKEGMEERKLFPFCSLDRACLASLLLLTGFTSLLLELGPTLTPENKHFRLPSLTKDQWLCCDL